MKERDAGHRELHTRGYALQRILAVGLAGRRLAIELDVIEAGVDADETERQRRVDAVSEPGLCALNDGVARRGLIRLRELTHREIAGAAQAERDPLGGEHRRQTRERRGETNDSGGRFHSEYR